MAKAAKKEKSGAEGITWDLSDLYSNLKDKKIQRDIKDLFQKSEAFEKKYRGKINSPKLTPKFLLNSIEDLEYISEKIGKLLSFAYLVFAGNTRNPENGAFLQMIQEKSTEARKHLMFFELEWIKLSNKKVDSLLNNKILFQYKHFLEQERSYKPHKLSEPEEKILDEKANTGSRAFKRLFDEILNNIRFKIRLDGKTKSLSETEILALLYNPNRNKRKAGAKSLTVGLKENSHVLTYIFNTLVQDHALNDRLRLFENPMDSRNLSNEIDKKTLDSLMTSCERNYDMVDTYYSLKKRLLGIKKFYDYDRYAPIFHDSEIINYKKSKEIILGSFHNFSPKMANIAQKFFDMNWIDAEVRDGKRGGAFSHGTVPSAHPYVFTNYTGRMRDVMTLAHELGHGVHQYLSRQQGYFQSDTPLTTAETASVFAEILVFHKLMETEKNPKIKLALICGKLEDIFATVFRQVVLTRFEESLHHARRDKGELTSENINELWAEANKPMFGKSVSMSYD
ncbi:MAG: M3 family oligoendopeptidase, partial [Thermodesulfobacteriota bacterium]